MASLAEALYALPTERLRTLVQNRKVDLKKLAMIPSKRQLAQFLAGELSKAGSMAQAVLQCNVRQLRLLQLLLIGEGERPTPWIQLLEAAGGAELAEALQEVAAQLEERGLAFRIGQGVYLPPAVRGQVPASLPDRYTLLRCLSSYDAISLKRIWDNLGLPADTRVANPDAIRAHLLDQGRGLHLNRPLDEQERAVLEYMVQVGGATTPIEIASSVLDGQTDDFFRYDWQHRWKQGRERNAVDRLLGRGILHVVAHNYGFNLLLILPGDLLRALSGDADIAFWTGPTPTPEPLAEPPAAVMQHTTLIRDVVGLLGFLTMQDAARTNTGHIHKTSLKNLARQLALPDERYASFLYALCREADLIAPTGEKQLYSITGRGSAWLCWDTFTQARTLFEAWRKGAMWAEMCSEPLYKAGEYRHPDSVVEMREAVLGILTAADASPFFEIGSVTDTLAFRYPLMLARGLSVAGDLVPSPAVFVRLLICECLHWLGLVELGYMGPSTAQGELRVEGRGPRNRSASTLSPQPSALPKRGEPGQPSPVPEACAYRLTSLGAYLLGMIPAEPTKSEPREDQFIVQANAEIFVPPFLEPATLYHLLTLTEIPAKGAAGSTVSLTRESIRRSLDKGESARDILSFLQAHARTGIPQNVEYLINEVSGKHGHIHIGKAQMYLQVDSPLLLTELQSRRELKPYFVRALSDTVAILQAEDQDKLLRDLRKTGYLPVSDDKQPARSSGLKARAASDAPTVVTPKKPARHSAGADAIVDWARIARDDAKPWAEARIAESIVSAVKNPALIRVLLAQAIKHGKRVEVEYFAHENTPPLRSTIRPVKVENDLLTAFDQSTSHYANFPIGRIQWARLIEE